MGIRHCQGALQVDGLESICVSDISDESLNIAKQQLATEDYSNRITFQLIKDVIGKYDIVIIASTAKDRLETCKTAITAQPKHILIEKPLGQSWSQVIELDHLFKPLEKQIVVSVNLSMKMFPFVKKLKSDLSSIPQLKGPKSINFHGGALGIGSNGIHYLDLLFYLFDADRGEMVAGEIDSSLIPSGRGSQYRDFGGWACFKFYDSSNSYLGMSLFSLSAVSTVFGGWDIIGTHGRIRINEIENERIDIFRRPESNLPINRYAADYMQPISSKIEPVSLSELTKEWIEGIFVDGKSCLPFLGQTLKTHRLMFDWLERSEEFTNAFPIT
jgi:predicted dehydrogenase